VSAAVPAPADLLLVSQRVMTMADGDPVQQDAVVAVSGGRVAAILAREELDAYRGPDTRVIDVGDRPLLPGFVDPHSHSEVACRASFGTVDVRAPECGSVADVQERLADAVARGGTDGWVIGQGNLFFDRKLAEGRLPTKRELDHVSRTMPIAIRAACSSCIATVGGSGAASDRSASATSSCEGSGSGEEVLPIGIAVMATTRAPRAPSSGSGSMAT